MQFLFAICIFLTQFMSLNAVFFLVKQDEPRCFTFEQPRDTPVVFVYEILDEEHTINFRLYYGTRVDDEVITMSKKLAEQIGHIDFMTDVSGEFTYCFHKTAGSTPTRLRLDVNYGFDAEHYSELARKHDFDAINMEIHKLNDIMSLALGEAEYLKKKEIQFHDETIDINFEEVWWPIVQICILLLAGYIQVMHLKNFFKSRKLVSN